MFQGCSGSNQIKLHYSLSLSLSHLVWLRNVASKEKFRMSPPSIPLHLFRPVASLQSDGDMSSIYHFLNKKTSGAPQVQNFNRMIGPDLFEFQVKKWAYDGFMSRAVRHKVVGGIRGKWIFSYKFYVHFYASSIGYSLSLLNIKTEASTSESKVPASIHSPSTTSYLASPARM